MTTAGSETQSTIKRGVVGVLFRDEQFLVIRRSKFVRSPRAFCFPGGTIEPGESEEIAVIRELQEELNLTVRPVRPLLKTETSWKVALAWWLIDCENADALVANPEEVESVHWLNGRELRALTGLLPSNHTFLDAWERGEFTLALS